MKQKTHDYEGLPISFFIVMFISIAVFITFIIGTVVFVKNQYPEPQVDVVVFDDRLYDCQSMVVNDTTNYDWILKNPAKVWVDREGNQFILINK